jgi:hypothetical protein
MELVLLHVTEPLFVTNRYSGMEIIVSSTAPKIVGFNSNGGELPAVPPLPGARKTQAGYLIGSKGFLTS